METSTLAFLSAIGIPGVMVSALAYFLKNAFEDVRSTLKNLEASVNRLNETLSEHNASLRVMEQRLDGLEEDLKGQEQVWHKTTSRVTDLALELARLSGLGRANT